MHVWGYQPKHPQLLVMKVCLCVSHGQPEGQLLWYLTFSDRHKSPSKTQFVFFVLYFKSVIDHFKRRTPLLGYHQLRCHTPSFWFMVLDLSCGLFLVYECGIKCENCTSPYRSKSGRISIFNQLFTTGQISIALYCVIRSIMRCKTHRRNAVNSLSDT